VADLEFRRKWESAGRSGSSTVMDYDALKKTVAFGDARVPALFFEHVFPVDTADAIFSNVKELDAQKQDIANNPRRDAIINDLLPNARKDFKVYSRVNRVLIATLGIDAISRLSQNASSLAKDSMSEFRAGSTIRFISSTINYDIETIMRAIGTKSGTADIIGRLMSVASKSIDRSYFKGATSWYNSNLIEENLEKEITQEAVSLIYDNILTPSQNSLSWDLILEFRKKPQSMKALRDFRLFLNNNYSDKSAAYIYDDISAKFDKYNQTLREWGIETASSVISTALSKEGVASTALATICGALFHQPVAAAAAAGAGITLLGTTISVATTSWKAHTALQRESPVRYLKEIKKIV
jgi:hypothetical protein